MRSLRTLSTQRLLATLTGLVVAIGAGAAIAVAAAGGGPVAPRASLARAVHGALSAPSVSGITARISFTNRLIDASDIQGSDPLLQGGSGRLWLSRDHRVRVELQSANGDAQAVLANGSFWVYDPSSKTVYEGRLPAAPTGSARRPDRLSKGKHAGAEAVPSIRKIQSQLNAAMRHLLISGAVPGDLAGHPEYTVRVSPKQHSGLLGGLELAWDSKYGVPLRFGVYARGDSSPVIELRATDISYGAVPSSVFAISPPSDAKVVNVSSTSASSKGASNDALRKGSSKQRGRHRHTTEASGVSAVAKRLSFKLTAPSSLAGMTRQGVRLLGLGHRAGALVTYGQGLDGIAVIEQPTQKSSRPSTSTSGDQRGLSLPTISVNGVSAQQLQTALGTVVRFDLGGVTYTVLGSRSAASVDAAAVAVESAARGL